MARKKGSRNKGYWFRKGRGWYVGDDRLPDPQGKHIRDADDRQAAGVAYHALMPNGKPEPKSGSGFTVREVCRERPKEAKAKSSAQTYLLRKPFLCDFCEAKRAFTRGTATCPSPT